MHAVRALAARERRLVEGDVADQVEGVEVLADLLGQLVEEDALAREFLEDGLLALGVVPRVEEVVERRVRLANGLARVVLERFGDQLAVLVEVLDALGDDADLDVVDVVLASAGSVSRPSRSRPDRAVRRRRSAPRRRLASTVRRAGLDGSSSPGS